MTIAADPDSLPLPPGHFGLPLLGESLSFFADPEFAKKRHRLYGPVFKTNLLGKPTIFLKGVEANRFVLTHENDYFVVGWPPSTKALLGPLSLAMQTGAVHASRRKLLAQAFLPRSLSGYISTMESMTQEYLQRWQAQRQLTWYPELRRYTFDIACKLLVGLDQGSRTSLGQMFELWSEGLFSIPVDLPWTKFGKAKESRSLIAQELERLIQQRQDLLPVQLAETLEATPEADALGILLQATDDEGQRLSLAELKDQILVLLFAGHETLTSAIASFCLLTAQHPTVLDRLRAEQQNFPAHEPLSLDRLKQMTYLDQVIREVLRLVPPVGAGFREVLKTCMFQGFRIPQGWNVLYQIGSTHHDASLYDRPDDFDPDRFSQTQSLDQQKYGYVPFGGGVRECLGKEFARLEMKIFAVHLVRGYKWYLQPQQNLDLLTIPTPHPRDGLKVELRTLG